MRDLRKIQKYIREHFGPNKKIVGLRERYAGVDMLPRLTAN